MEIGMWTRLTTKIKNYEIRSDFSQMKLFDTRLGQHRLDDDQINAAAAHLILNVDTFAHGKRKDGVVSKRAAMCCNVKFGAFWLNLSLERLSRNADKM